MPRQSDSVRIAALFVAIVWAAALADAQTLAGLQGRVFDASGAAVPGALIRVQDHATGFDASVRTDSDGR